MKPVTIFDKIANDPMENHGIPMSALHRLQMQNTMQNLKKVKQFNFTYIFRSRKVSHVRLQRDGEN